jgi:hypothetical protein
MVLGVLAVMLAFGQLDGKMASADHKGPSGTDSDHVITAASVTATADPNDPGAVAKQTITFTNPATLPGNTGEIIIEFEDDVGAGSFPTVIAPSSVTITSQRFSNLQGTSPATGQVVANPLGVNVRFVAKFSASTEGTGAKDEPEVTLTIGDMEPSDSTPGVQGILGDVYDGSSTGLANTVTVDFRQTAGIKNPTQAKDGFKADGTAVAYKVQVATNADDETKKRQITADAVGAERSTKIVRKILINDADAARGKVITVTGKGFVNGTSATIWQDDDGDGSRDSGEIDLGSALVGSDDTFSAQVTVTVPPFVAGLGSGSDINFINATDGRRNTLNQNADFTVPKFKVEGSVSVTPATAGVGDTVQIDLKDWNATGTTAFTATSPSGAINGLPKITLGGVIVDTPTGAINASGEATFNVTIPNGVSSGVQSLQIDDDGASFTGGGVRRTNVTVSSAILTLTPETNLVPNQTVTVIGRGYTTGGSVTVNGSSDDSAVTISGSSSHLKVAGAADPRNKLNEGSSITVDNGGNWSASLVVPITTVTTTEGDHELKIVDSSGREGVATLTLAERTLVLSPLESRVGTTVNISGTGYPADNTKTGSDSTPSVTVEYTVAGTARSVATLTPDSSGNINGSFVVPLDAGIPSTNAVRAKFTIPRNDGDTATGGDVTTAVTHEVPRATLTVDPISGPVGTLVNITGEGFKTFSTVKTLQVGDIDVRPAPVPATDDKGGFTATVVVPQLNTGTHSVKGEVSTTTASGTFTVLAVAATATPVPASAAQAPADALAPLIANSDNLQRVWHFDASKQAVAPDYGWYLYDPRPVFAAANTVEEVSGGKFYWVNVRENQTATLGGQSRALYAGWNPVTW